LIVLARAHLRRHVAFGDAEDDGGGLAVNVAPALECVDEGGVARKVREQTQLALRVVGRQEHVTRRRDERAPDRFAAGRAHGDVLEVRVGR